MFARAAIKSRSSLIYGEPFFIPPRYESRSRLSLISQQRPTTFDFLHFVICRQKEAKLKCKTIENEKNAFAENVHSFIVQNNEIERVLHCTPKRQKRGLVSPHTNSFSCPPRAQVQFMCYKVPRTHNAGQLRARLLLLLFLLTLSPLLLQLALLGRGNRSE